jgi:hypothetical protein
MSVLLYLTILVVDGPEVEIHVSRSMVSPMDLLLGLLTGTSLCPHMVFPL